AEDGIRDSSVTGVQTCALPILGATGAALVLEDGNIAWPEGRPGAHNVRLPLRWKRRQIGELVCDRDTPFSDDDRALLSSIAHHEIGRASCRERVEDTREAHEVK